MTPVPWLVDARGLLPRGSVDDELEVRRLSLAVGVEAEHAQVGDAGAAGLELDRDLVLRGADFLVLENLYAASPGWVTVKLGFVSSGSAVVIVKVVETFGLAEATAAHSRKAVWLTEKRWV